MPLSRATFTWALAVACAAVLVGDLAAATPKERIRAKQRQAEAVLAQVNGLDRRFEGNVEAWNGARLELAATRRALVTEHVELRLAERRRRNAVARVERRLVELYEADQNPTAIAIVLGASSLSDLLDSLEAARAIADSDHRLAVRATAARDHYETVAERTSSLEQQQAETVKRLGDERRQIQSMLDDRRRLLSSVRTEVVTLQAAEARRQARLKAQAEARLAAAAAARREAAARAQAAAAAAEAAAAKLRAAKPAVTVATTTAPTTTMATTTTLATTTVATTTSPDPPPTTTAPVVPTVPATTTAPAASGSLPAGHPQAASIALRYLGIPYRWGGASPDGFDCSGLVMYVYAQLGISLPHFAAAQYGLGVGVPRDELQPGDLVFFDGLDHVGIYIGGGQMVHAPQTGDVVKITPLADFGNRYVGARRI